MAGKIARFDEDGRLSPSKALEKIQRFWIDGDYITCAYAQRRMLQRQFDDQDIRHLVLFGGRVAGHRKVDGLWRYTLSGKSVDRRRRVAVFEFEGSMMTLVTVHGR